MVVVIVVVIVVVVIVEVDVNLNLYIYLYYLSILSIYLSICAGLGELWRPSGESGAFSIYILYMYSLYIYMYIS